MIAAIDFAGPETIILLREYWQNPHHAVANPYYYILYFWE
jgi:hypothetical protein